ncbi:MAG TPA: SRPBCC domain-containing protein, partial [Bacteroidia bacterium]|nr:SRPBCC domain-containing protein [Bacteroidia bacterium]
MKKQGFTCSFTANISANDAIKKISKVSDWWGVTFSGNAEKQNDKFVIKMGNGAFFNCTVSELIPGKKVVWSVGDCNMPWYSNKKEWSDTKMIFDILESNGVSTITFTH